MTPGEIISLIGVISIGIGLIKTWTRNGHDASEKYGVLTEQVKESNKKLDGHGKKLDAIQVAVSEQRTNCATISTALQERITSIEREVRP